MKATLDSCQKLQYLAVHSILQTIGFNHFRNWKWLNPNVCKKRQLSKKLAENITIYPEEVSLLSMTLQKTDWCCTHFRKSEQKEFSCHWWNSFCTTVGSGNPLFPVNYKVKKNPPVGETCQLTNCGWGEVFLFVFSKSDYPPCPVQSSQQKQQHDTVTCARTDGLPHTVISLIGFTDAAWLFYFYFFSYR